MRQLLLKIGFNTLIQLIGKFISVVLSFFSIVLITRYLGSTGYGDFTLSFTYVSFFSVIADFGLQTTMVRELSQRDRNTEYHGSYLFLKLILIVASSLLAFFALFFFPYSEGVKLGIVIAIIAVSISGVTNYGTVVFQSRLRLDLVTVVDLITKIVTVGTLALFIYEKYNFYFIVSTVLVGNIVGLIITFFLIKEIFHFHFNLFQMKNMLVMSFPVGLTAFLGLAYFKIDTILLSVIKGSNEVGLYSLPYKILENFLIIWAYYMASVYPIFSRLKGKNELQKMANLFKNSFFAVLIISGPIIFFGILFAKDLIRLFGGENFKSSTYSLKILLFTLPFLFINNLFSDYFIVLKSVKRIILGIIISLVINIVLNLIFIPKYGFIGASYITVLSGMVLTIYFIVLFFLRF